MTLLRNAALAGALVALAACTTPGAGVGTGVDIVTRQSDLAGGLLVAPTDASIAPSWSVSQVNVVVPERLKVSEANSYKPIADIVWRGDPLGNRYAQVKTIFDTAIGQAVADMHGERAVDLDIEVARFHAQTERVRYTFGGEHELAFFITVRDAQTGAVIVPRYMVRSNFEAYGGAQALRAEAAGLTQKVRISRHLRELIQYELSQPVPHSAA